VTISEGIAVDIRDGGRPEDAPAVQFEFPAAGAVGVLAVDPVAFVGVDDLIPIVVIEIGDGVGKVTLHEVARAPEQLAGRAVHGDEAGGVAHVAAGDEDFRAAVAVQIRDVGTGPAVRGAFGKAPLDLPPAGQTIQMPVVGAVDDLRGAVGVDVADGDAPDAELVAEEPPYQLAPGIQAVEPAVVEAEHDLDARLVDDIGGDETLESAERGAGCEAPEQLPGLAEAEQLAIDGRGEDFGFAVVVEAGDRGGSAEGGGLFHTPEHGSLAVDTKEFVACNGDHSRGMGGVGEEGRGLGVGREVELPFGGLGKGGGAAEREQEGQGTVFHRGDLRCFVVGNHATG